MVITEKCRTIEQQLRKIGPNKFVYMKCKNGRTEERAKIEVLSQKPSQTLKETILISSKI